jgi:hypothetical protein
MDSQVHSGLWTPVFRRQLILIHKIRLHVSLYRLFSYPFLLAAIVLRVIQVLVTRDTKDSTSFEFHCQGNDVNVEESDLAVVLV